MTKSMPPGPTPEIGIVLYPGAQSAAVHGLTDIFALADSLARGGASLPPRLRVTHWRVTAGDTLPPACVHDSAAGAAPQPDFVILPPTILEVAQPPENTALARWLTGRHAEGATLVSICSGAFVLAVTGLLDRRTVSTHRSFAARLAAAFPALRIDVDRRIIDLGDVVTAGGFMAWIDIGMLLVGRLLGAAVRDETARFMFSDPVQRQRDHFAGLPPVRFHGDAAVARAQDWIHIRDGSNLGLSEIAARAGLERRTFQRRFLAATGMAPAQYCREVRMARARELLEAGDMPIKAIAASLGYREVPSFARVFRKRTGETPAAYRRQFGTVRDQSASL